MTFVHDFVFGIWALGFGFWDFPVTLSVTAAFYIDPT
jgi:hypothetical protein